MFYITGNAYGICHISSDAGTNLKVGAHVWRKVPEKILGSCPSTFWLYKTISRFGERFRDGQYSLFSLFVCCSSTHGAPVPSHL